MASKSLEILISAKDNASAAFKSVGSAADSTSSKMIGLNDIADAGKGVKGSLKTVKSLAIAFEAIPVGIEAVKAAYATLTGSAEQAASGQRALYDELQKIPVAGKKLAAFAEFTGTAIAHAFGKQSTAEIEAETAKKKTTLEEFQKTIVELGKVKGKTSNEAALAGLLPAQQEIEKAKQAYAKQIEELRVFKKSIIAAGGEGANVKAQVQEVAQIEANARKVQEAGIAAGHAKEVQEAEAFGNKINDIIRAGHEKLRSITVDGQVAALEADNRGYQARQEKLEQALSKETEAIRNEANKKNEELGKEAAGLKPLADAGNQIAKGRIFAIELTQKETSAIAEKEVAQAKANSTQEAGAARDEQVKAARLASLAIEAAAGDQNARATLDHLNASKAQEATERALQAIVADSNATDAQKIEANKQLLELKRAQGLAGAAEQKASGDQVRDAGLFVLQQEAALGDKQAERQLKKLEIEKQFGDERKKVLDILKSEVATDQQKADAQKILAGLNAEEKAAQRKADNGEDKGGLATLESSDFLTGVAAAAKERDQYQPIVTALDDAKDIHSKVLDVMVNTVKPYIDAINSGTQTVVTG